MFILFQSILQMLSFSIFRIWFSLLRYILYVTSLAVVFNFISFTYDLFFVLIASFNDWDSHGFRVLYFFVTILLGKCLLNNLCKVVWNQMKDSCAFPEICKVTQSISETALWNACLLRYDIFLSTITVSILRNLKWIINVDNRKVIWNVRIDYTLNGKSLIT